MYRILLLLTLASGCAHPAPEPAAQAAPRPVPTLGSVHFTQGSSKIAPADAGLIDQAVGILTADTTLAVALVGRTDTSGDEDSNRQLGLARAQYVRDRMVGAGIPATRIVIQTLGESNATGNDVEDRRVDFVFARGRSPIATPVPAPAPAAARSAAPAASAEKSAKPEKSAKSEKGAEADAPARDAMKEIGIADLDAFFGKVQAIRDRVWGVQDGLIDARTNLFSALSVAEGQTLDTALAELVKTAQGSISLTMVGTQPKLAVKNAPSPNVQQAVDGVNGMLDACMKIATELPKLQTDALALVEQAKAFPAQLPNMAKEAGASPTQIPKMLGAVKTNVTLTTKLPGEIKGLIDEGISTVNLVKSSFQ